MSFSEKTLEERKNEVLRLLKRYPNRIPIYLNKHKNTKNDLERQKFLVPDEMTVGQLLFTVRKYINVSPEKSLYLFFNKELVNGSASLSDIYQRHKSEDDMLYGVYAVENTFG